MHKTHPSERDPRKQEALTLLKQGQLKQARVLYETLCEEDNTDSESLFLLGSVEGRLGDFMSATQHLKLCTRLQPGAFAAHWGLGAAYKILENYQEAAQTFHDALELQPNNIEVLLELAKTYLLLKKRSEADACILDILKLQPKSADHLHRIGEFYHEARRLNEAVDYYKQALRVDPDRAMTLHNLGHALYVLGKFEGAVSCYEKAVNINPRCIESLVNMGTSLVTANRLVDARNAFQQAIRINPENVEAIAGEVYLYEHEGQFDEAQRRIAPLVRRGVKHPGLATTYVNICRHTNSCKEAVAYASRVLEDQGMPTFLEEQLHFALGKLHDRQGEYDKAFAHYLRANSLKPDNFNAAEHSAIVNALLKVFNWQFLASVPHATVQTSKPIFILGMPRSGTSLTEQILASHPQIYGAGELTDIGKLVGSIPEYCGMQPGYPFSFSKLTSKILDTFAARYLEHLAELDKNAIRVTDKMPQNFLHLGFISMVFPEARVIHCTRDPRDTCLSIYFQNFNEGHSYANDLKNIGLYYRQYETLMQHYKGLLSLPILEMRYEDLIADQEEMSRKLVDFVGLEWDERCLDFHDTGRFVATASHDQVCRKMYSSSIGRWKHYEKHIGPLLEALELR